MAMGVRFGARATAGGLALAMLADAGPRGLPETPLVDVHGVSLADQAELVHVSFATVSQQTMRAGGRTITMTKLRITDAGRQALADQSRLC